MTFVSDALDIPSAVTNHTTPIEIIWGARLLEKGFTAVPNILLRNYRKLGITDSEWGFLCNLLSYKHDERDPHPSQQTLAENMGITTRQVRNLSTSLQSKGFMLVTHRPNRPVQKYGTTLSYNFSPLMRKLLELMDNEMNGCSGETSAAQPPEIGLPPKRLTLKDKDTITTTKVGRYGIFSKKSVGRARNLPVQIIQKTSTHAEQFAPSVPHGNLGDSTEVQIGQKTNRPIQSFEPDSARRKIAMVMRQNMLHNYTETVKDIQALNALLVSGVPLDWILTETQHQFDIRPDAREKARCFGYMAEILKDAWQCELAKTAPVEPIDFDAYRKNVSRRRKKSTQAATKTTRMEPVQDERYENFYRLFPEETCVQDKKTATDSTYDARYEAFYQLFPEGSKCSTGSIKQY